MGELDKISGNPKSPYAINVITLNTKTVIYMNRQKLKMRVQKFDKMGRTCIV